MKPPVSPLPFRLVGDEISPEVLEALVQLLSQAQDRDNPIIGIAFAVMYKRRSYIVDTAGEARRNPTFTRGMLQALNDRLGISAGSRPAA